MPAVRDRVKQRPNRKCERTEHDHRLDDVRPDDRLDTPECGVNRGRGGQKHQRGDVNPDLLQRCERHAGECFVAEHQHDRRHVEPGAARQRPRDQKYGGGTIFRSLAKTDPQKLINGDYPEVVIGLDEDKGDDHARQQRANGKLCVGIVAGDIALIGSAEERGGADLRRKDRRQHCPPRDAPVPDGETFHRFVAPALVEADANYSEKVREKHPAIEQPGHKASVIHEPARNATSRKREGAGKPNIVRSSLYNSDAIHVRVASAWFVSLWFDRHHCSSIVCGPCKPRSRTSTETSAIHESPIVGRMGCFERRSMSRPEFLRQNEASPTLQIVRQASFLTRDFDIGPQY